MGERSERLRLLRGVDRPARRRLNAKVELLLALLPTLTVLAVLALLTFLAFGHGYLAAAGAMVVTIVLMVPLDIVHLPAVSTSLTFALRAGAETEAVLFTLALGMTAALVVLQRAAV